MSPASSFPAQAWPGPSFPLEEPSADVVAAVDHNLAQIVYLRRGGGAALAHGPRSTAIPRARTRELALCKLLYGLLCTETGVRPPWGMMTGVRPVRIIHDMRAEGASEVEIEARFLQTYDCTPQRFATAKSIADRQAPILAAAQPMDCSVYAGIPFLPVAVQFIAALSPARWGTRPPAPQIEPYVACLCRELTATREVADACGLSIKTFYIGGGTPTSLNAVQLRRLMEHIRRTFPARNFAGVHRRGPDAPTAPTRKKLRILKEYGATRISINPQTFSDEVLRNIGRKHSAQDILDCYRTARAVGHDNINMDLIAGLPGDTVEGFRHSLETAIALEPENITVHTLTLKRASNLVVEHRAGRVR